MTKRASKIPDPSPSAPVPSASRNVKVVGVGASAGGLEAFTELVRNLPTDSGLAFVLVQHLDPTHRSLLSELLARAASLPVYEISPETRVEPNRIYVIPPNTNLSIVGGILKLSPRGKNGGPARSIDHFLRSLAGDQGVNAIGVILSGAGSDGARGLKAIKDAGGLTFAQDERSSKYDSMPRSAIATGCVDFVLPPAKIAAEITRNVSHPRNTSGRAAANARDRHGRVSQKSPHAQLATEDQATWPMAPRDLDLRKILSVLRTKKGVDFSLYRPNTINRRLKRRLAAHKVTSLKQYARLLLEIPAEVEGLYQDLLINVTSFFRNPSVFEALKKKIFPELVKALEPTGALRFWVAGCSTGQEPYSLAMAFDEFCEKISRRVPVQIFATDINPSVLTQARLGWYREDQLQGLSPARLSRFFVREDTGYRVQKKIRDMVVFAPQNLLNDPPFTRVDLVSCRNMLIYIEPALQQKIIPTFHYALRPNGFLVLGMSETVGAFSTLFTPTDKSHKIYQRKPAVPRPLNERIASTIFSPPKLSAAAPVGRPVEPGAPDNFREIDRLVLARYGPPGVLVNEEGTILQFRGKVQPYLEIAAGKATLNVSKMARGTLGFVLQQALTRARKENKSVREELVPYGGPRQSVNLEVVPVTHAKSRCFLISFEKQVLPSPVETTSAKRGKLADAATTNTRRLTEIKRELSRRGDELESLREQHETAVEELQASNEEVQSSNEELQSLNEELETSNEELESANEELTTLNEELATRNTELRESEQRLREQAQLVELAPLLASSAKDRIIFWSAGAEKIYGFSKDEAVGQISSLLLHAQYPEPLEDIQARLAHAGRWEGEIRRKHKDGSLRVISAQWVIDRDENQKTRAILEVSSDVTARLRAEEFLRKAQELNRRILECTPDTIMVLDLAGRVVSLNPGRDASEENDTSPAKHWSEWWDDQSRPEAEKAYRGALNAETCWFQGKSATDHEDNRWWDVVIRPINDADGRPDQLIAVCRDITERKNAELAAREEGKLAAFRADVAVEVARGGELGPVLQQLTQIIVHHTDVVLARIWMAETDTPTLRLVATSGLYVNGQSAIMVGEGVIGQVAATKRAHITHNPGEEPSIGDAGWVQREGLTSFAAFPLVYESKIMGVLAVVSRVRLAQGVLREIRLLADAIALVVQRRNAEEERAHLLEEAMKARNAAVAASQAKDDFLAALSHELRTPLNPVLLLASDGAGDPDLPAPVRATFETIRNNVRLEAKLIDDLLDLTRITHGKLELELKPLDLNVAIREAVNIVSDNLERSRLTLELHLAEGPLMVLGDSTRLHQVFWNILNNAAKFTPANGTITVRSEILANKRVVVRIIDTGIGMKVEDLRRVFDPFRQIDSRKGGLGLGLTISRQLIERQQGSIRALSDGVGAGSTFEIELPLIDLPAGSNGPAPLESPAKSLPSRMSAETNKKQRLLLVEDHGPTRNTLRDLLVRRKFDVVVAGSVAEAVTKTREGEFDLVISDLGLPDGDGFKLLATLRQHTPEIRAVALSGYGTEDDRERSAAAGFVAHLTKPIGIEMLDKTIAGILHAGSRDR